MKKKAVKDSGKSSGISYPGGSLQKAILLILALIVLFGSIYYGYWYFVQNTGKNTTSSKLSLKVSLEKASNSDQLSADTWKTYTNEKFGYQIMYHPDWKAQKENEPPYPPPPSGMSFSRKFEDSDEWCDFSILSFEGIDSFQGEIQNTRDSAEGPESSKVIDKIKAIEFDHEKGDARSKSYYFTEDGNSFRIGFNLKIGGTNEKFCTDTFEKMTKTFKFL